MSEYQRRKAVEDSGPPREDDTKTLIERDNARYDAWDRERSAKVQAKRATKKEKKKADRDKRKGGNR